MFFRVNLWLILFAAFLCACDSPRIADTPAPSPSRTIQSRNTCPSSAATKQTSQSANFSRTLLGLPGPTSNPRPAGDVRSSVDDYARFLQMLLREGNYNGRQVLSPRAVMELHADQTRGARIGIMPDYLELKNEIRRIIDTR